MISHEHKYIFIEIPKTGTTTICSVLKQHEAEQPYKHLDLKQYKERYTKEYNSYFKFSFVRNPWDRVVSLYSRKGDGIQKSMFRRGQQIGHGMSFEQFVDWIELSTDTCRKPTPKKNMVDFYMVDGSIDIDFVGRLENIQEDFNIVCNKIGIPRQQLPHINKSKHKHYTRYYDDKTKQIIAEKFAKDIEYFGYEFGE
tara:strand:+ start:6683 stop:7273 length:591 start_codon:yes stop_codon:yes gene_type:complete